MATCKVPGCLEEVRNQRRQLCSKCASSSYYWDKKSKSYKKARIETLEFWKRRTRYFSQ